MHWGSTQVGSGHSFLKGLPDQLNFPFFVGLCLSFLIGTAVGWVIVGQACIGYKFKTCGSL
jgi:hypothetical protein